MKKVEYWRWRYRDLRTGQICRTMFQLTAEEAARYPEAERIEGSMLLREVDDDIELEGAGAAALGEACHGPAGRSVR